MSDSNVELQLKKLNDEPVELPEPQSRVELYLAKLNGESVELPEPQSRIEELLFNLAQKSDSDDLDFIRNHYKVINDTSNKYGYWNEDGFYVPTETFDVVIPDWVKNNFSANTLLQNGIIRLCSCGNERSVVGNNVETLDNYAYDMRNCAPGASKLESLYFPKAILKNTYLVSNNDGLKNITIQNFGGPTYGRSNFKDCTNLENLTLTDDVLNVDLHLYWSNELTQECLHSLIEKYAKRTSTTNLVFWIGPINISKIDEEHIKMLENAHVSYK